MPIADPQKSQRFPKQEKGMLHCDLRVRWKVASDLRFRAAISAPKTPSFYGISGAILAPATRKSLAIAIVRFRCAKIRKLFCCTKDVCVCEYLENSQRILLVCNWHSQRYFMEAPELHEKKTARKSCERDVLCDWEIIPK